MYIHFCRLIDSLGFHFFPLDVSENASYFFSILYWIGFVTLTLPGRGGGSREDRVATADANVVNIDCLVTTQ